MTESTYRPANEYDRDAMQSLFGTDVFPKSDLITMGFDEELVALTVLDDRYVGEIFYDNLGMAWERIS